LIEFLQNLKQNAKKHYGTLDTEYMTDSYSPIQYSFLIFLLDFKFWRPYMTHTVNKSASNW